MSESSERLFNLMSQYNNAKKELAPAIADVVLDAVNMNDNTKELLQAIGSISGHGVTAEELLIAIREKISTQKESDKKSSSSLNEGIPASSIGVSRTRFDAIDRAFDLFTRTDINDEAILDAVSFDEENILELSSFLDRDCSGFAGQYILFYVKPE